MRSSSSPSPRMSTPQQATSATRRRLACDRCHQQKLRCLRTANPDGEACDRCLRLSAECVYSPSCRIGRPPLRLSSEPSSDQKRPRARTTTRRNAPPMNSTPRNESPQPEAAPMSEHEPPEMNTAEDFDMNDACNFDFLEFLNDPAPFDPGDTGMMDPGVIPDFSGGVVEDSGVTAGGIPCITGPDDCVRELASISLALHDQLRTVGSERRDPLTDSQGLIARLRRYPIRNMFEHTQKLVSISEGLAEDSTPPESVLGSASTSERSIFGLSSSRIPQTPGHSSSGSSLGSLSPPDCRTTCSTFTDRFSPSSTRITAFSANTRHEHARWAPTSAAKVDTSVILLMLSCHVSLLRLYTFFCSDLRQHLLSHTGTSVERLFPDLTLGSFQVLAGMDVEILLVVQVCTHMLDRLHKARRDCAAAGLVTPALVHAVQMQEEMEAQRDGNDVCKGISTLLKDIKKLIRQKVAI